MWQSLSRGGASKDQFDAGKSLEKSVLANLKDLSEYKGELFNTAGAVITDMSNTAYRVLSNTSGYTETFAEDDSLSWATDPDKLQDISDSRG
jgi:hypothetical protein